MADEEKWEELTDESGHTYYHNTATGETAWEKPAALVAAEQHFDNHHHQQQQQQQQEGQNDSSGGGDGDWDDWEEHWSDDHQKHYYVHKVYRHSVWADGSTDQSGDGAVAAGGNGEYGEYNHEEGAAVTEHHLNDDAARGGHGGAVTAGRVARATSAENALAAMLQTAPVARASSTTTTTTQQQQRRSVAYQPSPPLERVHEEYEEVDIEPPAPAVTVGDGVGGVAGSGTTVKGARAAAPPLPPVPTEAELAAAAEAALTPLAVGPGTDRGDVHPSHLLLPPDLKFQAGGGSGRGNGAAKKAGDDGGDSEAVARNAKALALAAAASGASGGAARAGGGFLNGAELKRAKRLGLVVDATVVLAGGKAVADRIADEAAGKTMGRSQHPLLYHRLTSLPGHGNQVTSLVASPTGGVVISSSLDRTIKVWSAATGGLARTVTGHKKGVTALALCGDNDELVCSG